MNCELQTVDEHETIVLLNGERIGMLQAFDGFVTYTSYFDDKLNGDDYALLEIENSGRVLISEPTKI